MDCILHFGGDITVLFRTTVAIPLARRSAVRDFIVCDLGNYVMKFKRQANDNRLVIVYTVWFLYDQAVC